MLGELLKAIKIRWTAKGLASTFPGGISEGTPVPGSATSWPFVTVNILGSSNTGRRTSSNSTQFNQEETVTVELIVHSRGGLSAASTLSEALKTAFDNAVMTLASGVTLCKFWYQGEMVVDDPDHANVKDWSITYQAVLEQAKTLVNT